MRTNTSLPVHIVEDHSDAFYYIARAIGSKKLPYDSNLLVHFDSHPDLLIPSELHASEIFDISAVIEKLSIENWILPLAFAGHLSTVVWIKPSWSLQIDDGVFKFKIGKCRGTDMIRVSAAHSYFISEMLYCDTKDLIDFKEVSLYVFTICRSNLSAICSELLMIINQHNGHYVLDIDLDYFSTLNPFIGMYSDVGLYKKLEQLYHFSLIPGVSVVAQQLERTNQILSLGKVFRCLDEMKDPDQIKCNLDTILFGLSKEAFNILSSIIIDLITTYGSDLDWSLIHDAGCTCDDPERPLPHHESSSDEIMESLCMFSGILKVLPSPDIVTVARSSSDGYCPATVVDMIQEKVLECLNKFLSLDVQFHYEVS